MQLHKQGTETHKRYSYTYEVQLDLRAVFRIRMKFVSWIRIPNADPDPAADKISSKSQNNSYHLELFD